MRRLVAAFAAVAASVVGVVAGGTVLAFSATPVCKDSNGAAPGGSVYFSYYANVNCDVRPPQRLHITSTPSAAACRAMGGHDWSSRIRICWDVDY